MEFEIKDIDFREIRFKRIGYGANEAIDKTTYTQSCIIKVGIKGISNELGFTNEEHFIAEFPATGIDVKDVSNVINQQCIQYITDKYPDIEI